MNIKHYPEPTDLTSCESEPIHLIPRVQAHGCLIVLNRELKIVQASENCIEFLGVAHEQLIGSSISSLCDESTLGSIQSWKNDGVNHSAFDFHYEGKSYTAIPHWVEDQIVIDLEPTSRNWDAFEFQQNMLGLLQQLNQTKSLEELKQKAAELIKDLLGYDRVMIYEFDPQWNGAVVAEACEESLPSWLGIHYPASDIPAQARRLFLEQGVRILSDVNAEYSTIRPTVNPSLNALLPTGHSHLRGSSPIHIEYLTNMGVSATLNCAIVKNGALWGLIACHNYAPKFVSFQKRKACQFLAEMLSNQLDIKNNASVFNRVNDSTQTRAALIKNVSKDLDLISGLCLDEPTGMDLVDCDGFAVFYDNEYQTVGNCPDRALAIQLAEEIENKIETNQYYATDCLVDDFDWMGEHASDFSGILYYKISRKKNEAVMWLRKEKVTHVNWGGNPKETDLENEATNRLSPRKSFEKWAQEVRCTSSEWLDYEKAAANALVEDIKNVIVTRYGEVSQLNRQLNSLNQELESFSYSVSHDLRGPLRGIDGFAQILMEDYQDVLDDYGKQSLKTIITSAEKMNHLMDDILSYSGLSKMNTIKDFHDPVGICQTIINENRLKELYPNTKLILDSKLPQAYGDKAMLYQLFSNLLTNAFKYSSKAENPVVEVGCYNNGQNHVYFVKDNGTGFEMKYKEKIFGVFTRLVTTEFEGTGVGLAIVQRIVFKHNGEIWVDAAPNEGANFQFYLEEPVFDH